MKNIVLTLFGVSFVFLSIPLACYIGDFALNVWGLTIDETALLAALVTIVLLLLGALLITSAVKLGEAE